jgi:protein TonB
MKIVFLLLALAFSFGAKGQSAELKLHGQKIDYLNCTPEFPGGDVALQKFLQENLIYPTIERDNEIQGRVVIGFVVNNNGELEELQLLRSIIPGIDKEAMRVIKQMPAWNPAIYYNKPIKMRATINIVFKLAQN